MARIWICCSHCGSRDVTRDGILRWDEGDQCWEMSAELDNSDCEACGEERDLEEVPIVADDREIYETIQDYGWTILDAPNGLKHLSTNQTGAMHDSPFDELADAYLWARANATT